jgi:BlaI family transcriptional regulator, penicillinase repressor
LGDTVLSERELEILKVLWELGSASVREVHQHLYPGGERHFNTVQTVLRIMEEKKGLVTHREEGRTFVYTPAYSREQVTARFLNKVFDGAMDQLVLSLLEASDASAEDLKDLEKLIARARRRKQAKRTEGE